ncbi:bifunctional hydroxymethylpyrimidine kinase/phosphomethylpyrimidine kinase [Oceanicella actignis]|uniref:bifunctional hydroxymethylpyrimidine kinase/phosphomethylpyrimidine kinase n=1 Tax=Oceanicella actignis TaxID=1189325 RepID=UPI0011E62BEE|nr:bifunctional hydroxymethylpyrimidine kinase/phosphomethylpyrimidine kinase [Oceanicella actignis]TYO89482.1 hydroxymethylpyrimidine kinase /phosphomethylpyrimidine kinase [Oceanicella actignis]
MTPVALTIAGSDSGGGAGVQADLKTFAALGVHGACALTAVTAQNTCAVTAAQALEPALVRAQIAAVAADMPPAAVKIGMLANAEIVEAVVESLDLLAAPAVLDPVMTAKSGDALLSPDAEDALRARLLPRAALVTPNLPEAARLLGRPPARDAAEALSQARALVALGARAALVKGGHAEGEICRDVLVWPGGEVAFAAPRIATRRTHGTGCTLSAAIAALLARGWALPDAVGRAHAWLHAAIRAADALAVGRGRGPVHHFHALWPPAVPEPTPMGPAAEPGAGAEAEA